MLQTIFISHPWSKDYGSQRKPKQTIPLGHIRASKQAAHTLDRYCDVTGDVKCELQHNDDVKRVTTDMLLTSYTSRKYMIGSHYDKIQCDPMVHAIYTNSATELNERKYTP